MEARDFTLFVKKILNDFFINKTVLDVGSGDINGNNGFLFENCYYIGNDVIEARNVSIVSKTKDLPFKSNIFDTIISTECFEHDPVYFSLRARQRDEQNMELVELVPGILMEQLVMWMVGQTITKI